MIETLTIAMPLVFLVIVVTFITGRLPFEGRKPRIEQQHKERNR